MRSWGMQAICFKIYYQESETFQTRQIFGSTFWVGPGIWVYWTLFRRKLLLPSNVLTWKPRAVSRFCSCIDVWIPVKHVLAEGSVFDAFPTKSALLWLASLLPCISGNGFTSLWRFRLKSPLPFSLP